MTRSEIRANAVNVLRADATLMALLDGDTTRVKNARVSELSPDESWACVSVNVSTSNSEANRDGAHNVCWIRKVWLTLGCMANVPLVEDTTVDALEQAAQDKADAVEEAARRALLTNADWVKQFDKVESGNVLCQGNADANGAYALAQATLVLQNTEYYEPNTSTAPAVTSVSLTVKTLNDDGTLGSVLTQATIDIEEA